MSYYKTRRNILHRIILVVLLVLSYSHGTIGQTNKRAPKGSSTKQILHISLNLPQKNLVLGKTKKAALAVTVTASNGGPVDGCNIQMNANVGSFSKKDDGIKGVFGYRYILPTQFFPQYAIISATANCSQGIGSNWIVVPLHGSGKVLVKSKPFRDIRLRVGETKFGPVTTDGRGKAFIPIVIPPGFQYGHAGKQKIDLNLPPLNRIAVSTDKEIVTAKTGAAQIWIYAIDKNGSPLENAKPVITAKTGTVTEISNEGHGVYRALYRPPHSSATKTDTVAVELEKDPISRGEIIYGISSGIPARVSISSPNKSYRAGTDSGVILDVKVQDAAGNPTDGNVKIASDLGKETPIRPIETGWYRTKFLISNKFKGRKKATIHVSVSAPEHTQDKLTKEYEIQLLASHPKEIRISELSKHPPQADGRNNFRLEASLWDEFGNPVTDANITGSADHGSLDSVSAKGSGVYHLIYRAPSPPLLNDFPKRDTIKIQAATPQSPLETVHEISIREREYLMAIEATVGFVTNFGNLHTPLFSLRLDFSLWFIAPGLFATIDGGYFFDNEESKTPSISTTLHGVPLFGSIGYRIRVLSFLELFALVGAGPQFIWYQLERDDGPTTKYIRVAPSVRPAIGVGFTVGPGEIVTQFQYSWIQSVSLPELEGRLGGLGITAGYRYSF